MAGTLPCYYTKVQNYAGWIQSITGFTPTPAASDLYIKDNKTDLGYPGTNGNGGDDSPDIWVRNKPDGEEEHESPEWTANAPTVYVYVRVHNRGCVTSPPNMPVSVYWSKAAGWGSWPGNWDGSQPAKGDIIGTLLMDTLKAGDTRIIGPFPWTLVNPYVNNTWNSCLLARIESTPAQGDTITVYPSRLDKDVLYNNNIALHNITIVDLLPGKPHPNFSGVIYPYGGQVLLSNAMPAAHGFNIRLSVPDKADGAPDVTHEAEVKLIFDAAGWAIMQQSGQLSQEGVTVVRDREVVITKPDVTFSNISLPANGSIPVWIGFSFLTDSLSTHQDFSYRLSQSFAEAPDTVLGSETFRVRKYSRNPFSADAGGDKEVYKNQSITITPAQVAEAVSYKWYDMDGNLVFTGKDLTISPDVTRKYRLEVIASLDGFKDYDEVEVKVKNFKIETISPNPATTQATVSYNIENAASAYLMVLEPYGNATYNYILSPGSTSTTINTSAYAPGGYNVVLICNGQVVEVKSFTVQ